MVVALIQLALFCYLVFFIIVEKNVFQYRILLAKNLVIEGGLTLILVAITLMGLNSVYSFIGLTLNDTGLQVVEIAIAFSIFVCLLLEVTNTIVMMVLGVIENIKWIISFCRKDKISKVEAMDIAEQKG